MTAGTVKTIVPDLGSGYVATEDGVEYYFHRTGVKGPLNFDDLFGGEAVSFEIDANFGDPRAVQVSAA
jgi:cold shock CspA family protein